MFLLTVPNKFIGVFVLFAASVSKVFELNLVFVIKLCCLDIRIENLRKYEFVYVCAALR